MHRVVDTYEASTMIFEGCAEGMAYKDAVDNGGSDTSEKIAVTQDVIEPKLYC